MSISSEPDKSTAADFVVVANRLPVDLDRSSDGTQRWTASPGGLVSALEPFLRSRKGAWVGWPGIPDAEVDEFDDDGLVLHPVTLTSDEVRDYYEGFSNASLWPLYHDVVARPVFDRGWWESMSVNSILPEPTMQKSRNGKVVLVSGGVLVLRYRDPDRPRPRVRMCCKRPTS